MNVVMKKILQGGWQVLRQKVWNEAAQQPRLPKLHGWDLRYRPNHSPDWTHFYRNALVPKKVTYNPIHSVWETLSVRLRNDAVQRVFSPLKNGSRYHGSRKSYVPYLAFGFVGLALADQGLTTNNNDLHESEKLEDLCDSLNREEQQRRRDTKDDTKYPNSLTGYQFDKLIGKGCYGAIFAAKLAETQTERNQSVFLSDSEPTETSKEAESSTTESCEGNLESEKWNIMSQDEIDITGSDWSLLDSSSESISKSCQSQPQKCSRDKSLSETDDDMKASDDEGEVNSNEEQGAEIDKLADGQFNLAVKVIFNDRVRSDTSAIESAFESEQIILNKKYKLQDHPSFVKAHCAFVDDNNLQDFKEAEALFPHALPRDQFQTGRGRNRMLYLVMHRYEMTLRQYLQNYPCRSEWNAQLMVCQLLEGAAFLSSYQLVHRDLKDDNILVEFDSSRMPRLAITDFGCSLALEETGLHVTLPWFDVSIAGNSALRAPEIKAVFNGRWPLNLELDYSKSDAWAIGSIAYQICGMENPFYQRGMDSLHYNENSLPRLPEFVSPEFQLVILGLLKKDPSKRLSSDVAANMIHLLLWKQDGWSQGPNNLWKMSYLERNLHNWLKQMVMENNHL
ncbi:putative serine/threonine-protein kinase PINK1, mitochondrial [Apostichopus japonicus]|uniref:non-specific serine/threonine protein kinase n=1 Tax=Stichopus japonicus TaxID=307972 RepID=A0A2G8K3C5_STIJA|nr:putative serine/threonine-protein kinase PINK1, mitochondrial [Apostichopus japonicus]